MISKERIDEAVKRLFDEITFTREPEGLYDPLRYMIAIGGKRIRPKLCLTTFGLFSDDFQEGVLEPAAGLEVFHTFTLIHDDMMDKSSLRRGHRTVWVRWNPDTAILSGDVMSIDSYRRMAKAPREVLPEVLSLFSKTAAEVCEGQQMDMEFETMLTVPMANYMKMIGLKTAVLLACSAKMGALIAGAPEASCDALYKYGYKLGLAFQVADDYLDAYGDASVFGKPIGGDILNGKKSWLTVRAMEQITEEHGLSDLHAAFSLRSDKEKIAAVKAIYDRLGVPDEAQAEILRLHEEALDAIRGFSPAQQAVLKDFAQTLVGRVK